MIIHAFNILFSYNICKSIEFKGLTLTFNLFLFLKIESGIKTKVDF